MRSSTTTDSRLARAALAAALLIALAVSAGAGTLTRSAGRRVLDLRGADIDAGRIALPDSMVVAGTDSLVLDGRPARRDIDYVLESGRAVRFLRDLADTSAITLTYLYIPGVVSAVHRSAVLDLAAELPDVFAGSDSLIGLRFPEAEPRAVASGLRVGGAKTFGLSVGSDRDLKLEQSLRLNVEGRVTRDVSVRAYLSDQNTPLLPEGDTEELRSLDKVLVEIEGKNASATMGDFVLDVRSGSLLRMRRELEGAMVTAQRGPLSVVAAGARADGEQSSTTFVGAEGKQGPYLLPDSQGAVGVTIVAGSERVWLDGVLLRRGSDNDYTIDYATGELQFSERRPITAESRIEVDYEHATSDFDRDIAGGSGRLVSVDGRFELGLAYFRDSDDDSRPVAADFTDADLAILAAAGDDVELAHDDGVDSVGYGAGDYEAVPDGTFEYAGADSGSYDLAFERFEGGDYAYDYVAGYYYYAGEGAGTHRLGRRLPLPTDSSIVAIDGAARFEGGGFVEGEAALSSYDANTLSGLDDDDNLGNAGVLRFESPAMSGGILGAAKLSAVGSARRVGGNFRGNGRFRENGYEDRWELRGLELPGEELTGEGALRMELPGGGGGELRHGRLERGEALVSQSTQLSMDVSPVDRSRLWVSAKLVDLDYSAAGDTAVTRERRLYRAGGDVTLGRVRPGVTWTSDEATENGTGERYEEYGATLASAGLAGVSLRAGYAYRLTDRRASGDVWTRASHTTTESYGVELTRWEALTVDASVSRRMTDFEEGFAEAGTRSDLARVRLGHTSLGGAVRGEVRYAVTTTEVEEKERYVTYEDDVEIVRIVSTGRYLPVTDLSAGTRWTFRPVSRGSSTRLPDPSAMRRWLTRLSLETDIRLREATTTTEKDRLYLLDPAVFRGDDTVSGDLIGRHTLRYTSSGGALIGRLAYRSHDGLTRVYANSPEERRDRGVTVELKLARPGGLAYRVQGDAGSRRRDSEGTVESYDVDERSVLGEISHRGAGRLELRLTGVYGIEDDAVSGVRADVWKLTPSATWRLKGRGSVSASVTRLTVESTGGTPPRYLAEGRVEGDAADWRLSADYRFNRYITGNLSYTGERRPGSDDRHTVDMRVNAFF